MHVVRAILKPSRLIYLLASASSRVGTIMATTIPNKRPLPMHPHVSLVLRSHSLSADDPPWKRTFHFPAVSTHPYFWGVVFFINLFTLYPDCSLSSSPPSPTLINLSFITPSPSPQKRGRPLWIPPHPRTLSPRKTKHILFHWSPTRKSS